MNEERKPIVIGETYGHVEVLELLPTRDNNGSFRYRVKCVKVKGGQMCGALTIKSARDLRGNRFLGCKECSAENAKQQRRRYARSLSFPSGA